MSEIKVNNLYKSYGDIQALKDISFEVDKGEIFGVIGPDGAGKTSLFRILVSLLLPDKGSVELAGYDVIKDYKEVRKIVGYMPGRFSLYQDMSVEENLQFYATVFGTDIKEHYELIRDIYIQIEPFKKRLAGKLSGGMKQKLALSCALIHRPQVLILDEPTTGVDAVSRKEFWEMLARLKKHDITMVVSTPYMDEANLCDRVALMQEGKILAVESPSNIIKNYGKKMIWVRSSNTYKLLSDLKKWENTQTVYPFGQYLHLTPKINEMEPELNQYLQSTGNTDAEIKAGFSNIEDVFMDLMSRTNDEKYAG